MGYPIIGLIFGVFYGIHYGISYPDFFINSITVAIGSDCCHKLPPLLGPVCCLSGSCWKFFMGHPQLGFLIVGQVARSGLV